MQERRRYKRITTEGARIQCKIQFAAEIKLLNISSSGASISLNKRLNIGDEYSLQINCGDSSILLKGVVVWEKVAGSQSNKQGESVPIYEAGIRFNNVLTDKGLEVISFIEKNFAPKYFKARLRGLRVEIIEPQESTITDYHKSYYVLNISLGGMLLETDQPLEVEGRFKMELNLLERKESIKFTGRVVSSSEIPGKIPLLYETGVEIVEINKENKLKLKEFIDSLQNLDRG